MLENTKRLTTRETQTLAGFYSDDVDYIDQDGADKWSGDNKGKLADFRTNRSKDWNNINNFRKNENVAGRFNSSQRNNYKNNVNNFRNNRAVEINNNIQNHFDNNFDDNWWGNCGWYRGPGYWGGNPWWGGVPLP